MQPILNCVLNSVTEISSCKMSEAEVQNMNCNYKPSERWKLSRNKNFICSVAKSVIEPQHGGESCGLNDRVHGISCRYSDKTSKQHLSYFS